MSCPLEVLPHEIVPLKLSDLDPKDIFFQKGLGDNGSMLLSSQDGILKDRELVQKLLLLGRSEIKMSKVVDSYHVVQQVQGKRRKARPSQGNVLQIFSKEFAWSFLFFGRCGFLWPTYALTIPNLLALVLPVARLCKS